MTTQVNVKANHGWPVKVTAIDPTKSEDSPPVWVQTVPKNEERVFHAHSNADLIIHEIQPNEPEE